MDRIKGRMTYIFLIILLLIIVTAGMVLIHTYKDFYRKNALLRVDPLEFTGVKALDPTAEIEDSEIWMIGDSRVRRWPEKLLRNNNTIANLGVEGQTSSQVLYRLMSYLETDTPSLIILETGINDLKVIGLDANLYGEITQQYLKNIEQIIHLCRVRNISMILIDIFPVGKIELPRRLIWNNAVNKAINAVNLTLESYCDNDMVFHLNADAILSDNGTTVMPEFQDDFLHINVMGYEALSKNLKELINKIINP